MNSFLDRVLGVSRGREGKKSSLQDPPVWKASVEFPKAWSVCLLPLLSLDLNGYFSSCQV